MVAINSKIPEIYQRFFSEFGHWQIPNEEIATCNNCLKCQKPSSAFLNTKCCSYSPYLPNYLVGGILQDDRNELKNGKSRIIGRIKNRRGVMPYGIIPPDDYTELRENLLETTKGAFTANEAESILCPYYDKGNCTIWHYRENLCSTFFCVSIGGDDGKKFWEAFNLYLRFTEKTLSHFVMQTLGGFPDFAYKSPSRIEVELVNAENLYDSLWGNWIGKEMLFYEESYKIICKLTQEDFKKITSEKETTIIQKLTETYNQFINPVIPEKLIINPTLSIKIKETGYVSYHSSHGSLVLPPILAKFLTLFDGVRQTTAIYTFLLPFKIDLEKDYIKQLYQLQILISPQ